MRQRELLVLAVRLIAAAGVHPDVADGIFDDYPATWDSSEYVRTCLRGARVS